MRCAQLRVSHVLLDLKSVGGDRPLTGLFSLGKNEGIEGLSKRLLRFTTIPLSVDSHTQWGGQEIGMCGKVGAVR